MGGCSSKSAAAKSETATATATATAAPVDYHPTRLEPLHRQPSTSVPTVSLPVRPKITRADSMALRQQQWRAKVQSLNGGTRNTVQSTLLAYGHEAATIFPIEELQQAYLLLLRSLMVSHYPTKNRADDLIERLIEQEEFGAVEMAAQIADVRCRDPKLAFEYVGDRLKDRDQIERYTVWFMENHQPTVHLDM